MGGDKSLDFLGWVARIELFRLWRKTELIIIRFWLIYRIFRKILIFFISNLGSKIGYIKKGLWGVLHLALASLLVFSDLVRFLGQRFVILGDPLRSLLVIFLLAFSFDISVSKQILGFIPDRKVLGGEVIEAVSPSLEPDRSLLNLEVALAAAKNSPVTDLEEGDFNDDLYFVSGGDALLPHINIRNPEPEPLRPNKQNQPRPRPFWAAGPDLAGYFIFPTIGFNRRVPHYYNAVDISANSSCLDTDIPVYAAASGLVIGVYPTQSTSRYVNGGYGNNVLILHPNGVLTRYAHLKSISIANNTYVAQGSLIAYMGGFPRMPGSGNSTGCHLHFEVRGAKNPFLNF